MRPPPPPAELLRFPVVGGLAILAAAITALGAGGKICVAHVEERHAVEMFLGTAGYKVEALLSGPGLPFTISLPQLSVNEPLPADHPTGFEFEDDIVGGSRVTR